MSLLYASHPLFSQVWSFGFFSDFLCFPARKLHCYQFIIWEHLGWNSNFLYDIEHVLMPFFSVTFLFDWKWKKRKICLEFRMSYPIEFSNIGHFYSWFRDYHETQFRVGLNDLRYVLIWRLIFIRQTFMFPIQDSVHRMRRKIVKRRVLYYGNTSFMLAVNRLFQLQLNATFSRIL